MLSSKILLFMKNHLFVAIIILAVLVSGCTSNILTGSVKINSDPEGASVYIDSEYKGNTPCTVRNIGLGDHTLQLRHEKYPNWEKKINIELGKELNLTADLSENLIPEITLAYEGTGSYAKGDNVLISGTAVSGDDFVTLLIEWISGESYFANETCQIPIDDESLFEYRLFTTSMPSGKYRIVAELSSGESESAIITIQTESQTNVAIVEEIVENYHKTHTYSYADFFVCADMALDVWNMVETQGINAKIAIGDVQRSNEKVSEANHAWVLAETSPGHWLALETTGGYSVSNNEEYYEGWIFDSSRELKEYLSLLDQYNSQIEEVQEAEDIYNSKVAEYNSELSYLQNLINTYNSYYAGRSLTPAEYQAAVALEGQIVAQEVVVAKVLGEMNQATENLNDESSTLTNILDLMMAQIE